MSILLYHYHLHSIFLERKVVIIIAKLKQQYMADVGQLGDSSTNFSNTLCYHALQIEETSTKSMQTSAMDSTEQKSSMHTGALP